MSNQAREMMDDLHDTRVVVLGGAGFLGSHLCTRLVEAGAAVTCIDNFITGRADNLEHLVGEPGLTLLHYDITDYIHVSGPVDHATTLPPPASPPPPDGGP